MAVSANGLPSYRRTILPNRSLTPQGAALLTAIAIAAAAATSAAFIGIGAWPVLPFVLASLAALGAMLYGIALHRDDFELIVIDETHFDILRRCGRAHSWHRFQRYWARVYFERPPRTAVARLYVRSHGRALEIGAQLDDTRRRILAWELGNVLGRPVAGA